MLRILTDNNNNENNIEEYNLTKRNVKYTLSECNNVSW